MPINSTSPSSLPVPDTVEVVNFVRTTDITVFLRDDYERFAEGLYFYNVPVTVTVSELKEMIRKQGNSASPPIDIPVASQCLLVNSLTKLRRDLMLQDEWTLEFCENIIGLCHSIHLRLYYKEATVVLLMQNSHGQDDRHVLKVKNRCAYVHELQTRIQEHFGKPESEQFLYVEGKPLRTERPVLPESYNGDEPAFIWYVSELAMEHCRLDQIQGAIQDTYTVRIMSYCATIHTLAGGCIPIGFHTTSDTLKDLKMRLRDEGLPNKGCEIGSSRKIAKIPLEELQLFANGALLFDDNMLMQTVYQQYSVDQKIDLLLIQSSSREEVAPSVPRGIEGAEYRAITLLQLKELAAKVALHCVKDGWKSTNPQKNQQPLQPHDVTLYDLVYYWVKPQTAKYNCSYVELVAPKPQKPRWFTSHTWGGTFFQLVACLEQHAADHLLDKANTTYWICALALNQHGLDEELPPRGYNTPDTYLQNSPFYRAMQHADGTVSVLDASMACYHRIWCVFEVAIALGVKERISYEEDRDRKKEEVRKKIENANKEVRGRNARLEEEINKLQGQFDRLSEEAESTNSLEIHKRANELQGRIVELQNQCELELYMPLSKSRVPLLHITKPLHAQKSSYLYDVYAATGGRDAKCIGLTDGITEFDQRLGCKGILSAFQAQILRQRDFPLHLCEAALRVKLENAEATVTSDKDLILHYLASANIVSQEPTADSAALHESPPNFHPGYDRVNAMLRGKFALSAYRFALDQGRDMSDYRAALSHYDGLQSLIASFKCEAFVEDAIHFLGALPTSLRKIELFYEDLAFEASDQFACGLARLCNLECFSLVSGSKLANVDCLFQELEALPRLKELRLDFTLCAMIQPRDTESHNHLQTLEVTFYSKPSGDSDSNGGSSKGRARSQSSGSGSKRSVAIGSSDSGSEIGSGSGSCSSSFKGNAGGLSPRNGSWRSAASERSSRSGSGSW
ncbi:expressed unknown protein [Seminavis robusta]|uniref:Uncharacterized protein n=1 Tax=Seminavis robusta TaxID=568900 RepID=A0A9N8I0Z5_9STRA|nr:expressed unknown protein [Seminavis robusta]|eukprot:Sro2986_g341670.1 n/a (967) ;mRNA; f:5753-8653